MKMRPQLLLVLTAVVCAAAKPLSKAAMTSNKLLLISFDGFRWDYDQDVDTPNLDQLAADGVKAKYITPPMLTMTSPSHFTTITGMKPQFPSKDAIDRHNLTDRLNVIITSDHGMTTVKKKPQVDEVILNKYLNLFKVAKFEILDYGGFGILTPRPGKEQEVFDALSNVPNITVYKKNEIPESFHLAKSERLPPIVIIADLGFNLNSRLIVYVNKGDHGFHNTEMDMKTIFRAFGPSFKRSYLSEPFDSIHIYPLMCKLLQIEPAPHNGSLSVTEDMLLPAPTTTTKPSFTTPQGSFTTAGAQGARLSVALLLATLLFTFTVL
ncbi:ectonucleotide pyrophosphatase/phosphodiesterase family member 7-like [Neolamprologus brichardi]|uniref:ectonucleotide pyrophosphatase/phosphodiesterase family member 7-like n=1 Tax=Neolamprologus brichardi TaxID=32507 RepID=UPI001643E2C0|nr:ectonucleotide pyrophosphatase/phosphodiesterase family member 7-like [Neolamprologus brichardi]